MSTGWYEIRGPKLNIPSPLSCFFASAGGSRLARQRAAPVSASGPAPARQPAPGAVPGAAPGTQSLASQAAAAQGGRGVRSSARRAGTGGSAQAPAPAPPKRRKRARSGLETIDSQLLEAVASSGRGVTAGELLLLAFASPGAELSAALKAKAVAEAGELMAAAAGGAAAGGGSDETSLLERIASCDGAPPLLQQVAAACCTRPPTPAELVELTLAEPPMEWLPLRFAEALEDLALPGARDDGEVFLSTSSHTLEVLLELLRANHASPLVHFCDSVVGEALAAKGWKKGSKAARKDAVRSHVPRLASQMSLHPCPLATLWFDAFTVAAGGPRAGAPPWRGPRREHSSVREAALREPGRAAERLPAHVPRSRGHR